MSNGPFKKKIYPDNYTNEYNTPEGVLASLLFQKQCTGQGFGLLKGEIQTKKPFKGPRPILPSTGGLPGKSTSIQFFANQCKFSSYLPPPPSYLIPCTLFFFSLIFFLMDGARWDHDKYKPYSLSCSLESVKFWSLKGNVSTTLKSTLIRTRAFTMMNTERCFSQ